MIALLLCRCPGAEQRARRFLEKNNVHAWASIPAYTGKVMSQQFFSSLPPTAIGPDHPGALQDFIARAGGYIVVAGWDKEHFMWSNIKNSDAKAQIDAELILEQFA